MSEIAESLEFYYARFFNQQPSITFVRDVSVSPEGALKFTKDYGRANRTCPVQIWDNTDTSYVVASFFTYFPFLMDTQDVTKTEDKFRFFLDQDQDCEGETGQRKTVSVELNNDMNDPLNYHNIILKIDDAEYKSPWIFENGKEAFLFVSYDYPTKELIATCYYPDSGEIYSVTAQVDLENALPNLVILGFDAYNKNSETAYVYSWYFESEYGATAEKLAENLKIVNPGLAAHLNRHFSN